MKAALTALFLLSLSVVDVAVAQLPTAGTLGSLSVQCQNAGDGTIELNKMQAAGVKLVRGDLPWWYIEHDKVDQNHPYSFDAYDQWFNQCKDRGMRVEWVLDGGGQNLYGTDGGAAAFQQAYSNFAAAAAARYKGNGVVYEVWNEPDGGSWPGGANVDQYMATVNQVVPAIRAADPNARIIGPATFPGGTGIDTTFLTNCFNYGTRYSGQKGLLDLVDAVSVHPYQSIASYPGDIYNHPGPPENVVTDTYTPLTTLMKQYHSNVALPIACSEWGYSTTMPGITAQVQGDYLARMMLVNLSQPGVVQSNWFCFQNAGTDPTSMEDNFGMVARDFTPKTAYNEMQLLTHSLKGETFTAKLNDHHTSDWLLVSTAPNGQETLAAWTTGNPRTVTVSGWGTLNLTSTPYYVNPTLLYGDINLDGTVDVQDLAILAANYRKHVTGGWMQGDFNNDGVVDVEDLALLAANYRQSYASDVVPDYAGFDAEAIQLLSQAGLTVASEPGALVLLATALLGPLAYAWRRTVMPLAVGIEKISRETIL